MRILNIIIFFILGSILGFIYTLIGLRLPENKKILKKLKCNKCEHELKFRDLIPIYSYISTRGRCRYCKSKLDTLYIYMEIFTGIMFSLAYFTFSYSYELLIALGIITLLMIIVVSDLTYLIIPDEVLIFTSIYFIIINLMSSGFINTIYKILGGLFLFILMYSIMIIGNKIFKKESMGGGDIKMMFVIGLVLSPLLGTFSIFLASLFALPMSIYLMKRNDEKVIPFGPFLLISFTFIYFTRISPEGILKLLGI